MKDYYEILGVDKNASNAEIKQAFRKLAIENHPDKGGKKERFQEIQEAYDILGKDDKKREYDNNRQGPNINNFEFFFNMHNNHSRTNQIVRKSNHFYNCDITLQDVHFGLNKKIKVKREYICKKCYVNCNECNGIGQINRTIQMGMFIQNTSQICNKCRGCGKEYTQKECDCINGKITEEKIFELKIPKGVEPNRQYIFKEWGEQAVRENEVSGDLVITINIKPHETFQRRDLNLIYECKITLKESIIGKTIQIKHFDEMLNLNTKIFGIINPQKQYIIYEKGLNGEENGNKQKKGDLYITFKIEYPEKTLNDDEINALNNVFNSVNLL